MGLTVLLGRLHIAGRVEVNRGQQSSSITSISAFLSMRKQRELRASAAPDLAPPVLPASTLVSGLLAEHSRLVDFPIPPKQKWVLTKEVFDCFLATLDPDRDKAGEKYEAIRLKLVKYFQWHASDAPDMDADETINRAARRISEGANIYNLKAYIYGVAKMVELESRRLRDRKRELEEASRLVVPEEEGEGDPELRKCFDRCLGHLTEEDRETITEYYQFEKGRKIENRKKLAERFGISSNALRIKAHRQRINLEACVRNCLGAPCA